MSVDAIRQRWKVGYTSAHRWLAENNIERVDGRKIAVRREIRFPDGFKEVAGKLTSRELAQMFNITENRVQRLRRHLGIAAKPIRLPIPVSFRLTAPTMTKTELAVHYGVGKATIERWCREQGVTPKRLRAIRSFREGAIQAPAARSSADLAARFLQRFCPVSRCNSAGQFSMTGDHYKYSSKVLTPVDLVALAERKGWNPDAWREVKAA